MALRSHVSPSGLGEKAEVEEAGDQKRERVPEAGRVPGSMGSLCEQAAGRWGSDRRQPCSAGDRTRAQEEAPAPGRTRPRLPPVRAFAPENQRPCPDLCPPGLRAGVSAAGAAAGARPGFRREGGLAVSGELESGPSPRTPQPRSSDTHEEDQARVPEETHPGRSSYKDSEMASLLGTRDTSSPQHTRCRFPVSFAHSNPQSRSKNRRWLTPGMSKA